MVTITGKSCCSLNIKQINSCYCNLIPVQNLSSYFAIIYDQTLFTLFFLDVYNYNKVDKVKKVKGTGFATKVYLGDKVFTNNVYFH
jgi:hypothetical protein